MRFELTVRFRTTVFKTVALILSATSPWSQRMESNHFRHGYVYHTVLLCNIKMAPQARLELATYRLTVCHSTNWVTGEHYGSGSKSRTYTRRAYETRVSAIWTIPLRSCVCRPQDNYKEKGVYYHETLVYYIKKGGKLNRRHGVCLESRY